MSTPDEPDTPPLTRRQLRELRNTGATSIIVAPEATDDASPTGQASGADSAARQTTGAQPAAGEARTDTAEGGQSTEYASATEADGATADKRAGDEASESAGPADAAKQAATPLARPAEPAAVHTAPVPDASVDLGASPLTRRQARQQERIRTASVPVISPDIASSQLGPAPTPTGARTSVMESEAAAPQQGTSETGSADDVGELFDRLESSEPEALAPAPEAASSKPVADRAVLNPMFGAGLLTGQTATAQSASSFEQLLARDVDTTGSVSASSALIMSHASVAPLVAPIDGTGEVLVTGTFALPEGLGSTGHARGTADGREADAVLVDGELPAHSSPTPIAASAAVSTIKANQDIIQPPAPEKGSKLMLSLAITAGVLALALVGVLVYALASGVIS